MSVSASDPRRGMGGGSRVKSQITLRWTGLKVQNGSKNLAIVQGRVRDDTKRGWEKKKAMHRHPASATGVLTCSNSVKQFLTCLK